MNLFLFLGLAAGLIYSFASVFLKRAMEKGASAWSVLLVSSLTCGIMNLPFFWFARTPSPEAAWFQPLLAGCTLYIGLVFTWLAVYAGDVSVANPVMGTKVIFVAMFTIILTGSRVPPVMWGASILIAVALFLLKGSGERKGGAFLKTVILASVASVSFAVSDVLIQKYRDYWGVGLFPPLLVGSMALMSLSVIPWSADNLKKLSVSTWKWLIAGSIFTALQMVTLVIPLVLLQHDNSALMVNIMFNSRGIWTVIIVWAGGRLIGTKESGRGVKTLASRLLGAVLILTAIILVLLKQ